jgi:heme-degrading monooxygenase HmoA
MIPPVQVCNSFSENVEFARLAAAVRLSSRIRGVEQDLITFDLAIEKGLTEVIAKAKGCRGFKVNRGIESPERYVLQIFWTTLENHTVDCRQSAAFAEWRAIVGTFFAQPHSEEQFDLVSKSQG